MCSFLSSMPIELTGSHSCQYLDAGVFIFYFIYPFMPIKFEEMVNVFFHGDRSTQRALGTLHFTRVSLSPMYIIFYWPLKA